MFTHRLRGQRRHMKMEHIARLELAGYNDTSISVALNVSRSWISVLRSTPEFIAIRIALASGILQSQTNDLEEDVKAAYEELRATVPAAFNVLKNALYNPDRSPLAQRLRMEAAKEVLDREGSLAKISKTEIKTKATLDFSSNDALATDLLSALQQVSAPANRVGGETSSSQTLSEAKPTPTIDDLMKHFSTSAASGDREESEQKAQDIFKVLDSFDKLDSKDTPIN